MENDYWFQFLFDICLHNMNSIYLGAWTTQHWCVNIVSSLERTGAIMLKLLSTGLHHFLGIT